MPTLEELIARVPEEGWLTLGMHVHRWSAGLRERAHGAWRFCGGATAEEALRDVLSKLPAPRTVQAHHYGHSTDPEMDAALAADAAYLESMGASPSMTLRDLEDDEDLIG